LQYGKFINEIILQKYFQTFMTDKVCFEQINIKQKSNEKASITILARSESKNSSPHSDA